MMHTAKLYMADTVTSESVDEFLTNAAWALCSTCHTVLQSLPGEAIFSRDMLFDIPYVADWNTIGRRRQSQVNLENALENAKRIDYDYAVGDKVLLRQEGVNSHKAQDKYLGPYTVTQVHTNGTIWIQRGTLTERLNIWRVTPYFE